MLIKKAKITAVALLLTMSLSACAKEETETTAAKENKVITETISQESEPESAPPADTDSQKEEPPSAHCCQLKAKTAKCIINFIFFVIFFY